MSLYGSFSKQRLFDEFSDDAIIYRGVRKTPAEARDLALQNLSGISSFSAVSGRLGFSVAAADTSGDVRPLNIETVMSGAGATGGRARFHLTINAAAGSWSNALKGHVAYGASGKTTGLGSAIVAELELSAGTDAGSYAPLEIELGLGSGAATGTRSSLMSLNVYGAGAGEFDNNGFLFDLNGVTGSDAGHLFDEVTEQAVNAQARLRVQVNGTTWYIPLCDTAALS